MKLILTVLNVLLIVFFVLKDAVLFIRFRILHGAKSLFMVGTALSWFVGIVVCNGDLASFPDCFAALLVG